MKRILRVLSLLLLVAIFMSLAITGCGEEAGENGGDSGPVRAAKEYVEGEGGSFTLGENNMRLNYEGGIEVTEEWISNDESEARVTLESGDGSVRWKIELESTGGEWEVVDGTIETLKDVEVDVLE